MNETNPIINNIPLIEAKKRVRDSYQPIFEVLGDLSNFYPQIPRESYKTYPSLYQRIREITVTVVSEESPNQIQLSAEWMRQVFKMTITKEGTKSEFIIKYSPEEVFSVSNKEFAKEIYTELKQILEEVNMQDKINKIVQANKELEKEIKL